MSESFPSTPLSNAPIIEAVFDFKVELPPGTDTGGLVAEAEKEFSDHYLKKSRIIRHSVEVKPEADESSQIGREQTVRGIRMGHLEENQLIQIHEEGFSFNRLEPYDSYDVYLPEVRRCWEIFAKLANPVRINMLTLRNINRVLIPKSNENEVSLSEYLKTVPRFPEIEGVKTTGFMSQTQLLQIDPELSASFTLASQPAQPGEMAPMILDIEAFKLGPIDLSDDEIWPTFDLLRDLKNRIFNGTLSEECLKPYR